MTKSRLLFAILLVFPIPSCMLHRKSLFLTSLFPSFLSPTSSFSVSTFRLQHTVAKAETKEGQKYTRIPRGCCSGRLHNGKRCYKRTLCFWNWFSKFNKKVRYCKLLGRDCLETRVESLLDNHWCCPSMNFFLCLLFVSFVPNNYDCQGQQLAAMMSLIPAKLSKRHDLS